MAWSRSFDELHFGIAGYGNKRQPLAPLPCLSSGSSPGHVSGAKQPRVAIIGAGAAGLATALGLAKHGFAVTLLEQSHVVGGRVRSCQVRQKPYDLGATWLHGRSTEQNPLLRYTEKLPQLEGKQRGGGPGPLTLLDGDAVDGKLVSRLASSYGNALEDCEGVAHGRIPEKLQGKQLPEDVETAVAAILSQCETTAPQNLLEASLQWRRQLECSISGCDSVSELSLAAWGEYQEIPSAQRASNRWEGGFAAVLQEALKDLFRLGDERCGGNVELHLNCGAERVHWSQPSADCCVVGRVESKEVRIAAQHVVITTSLGALKASELCFNPPLPESKQMAIQRLGFGTVDKVLLLYPHPWWAELWSTLRILWPADCYLEPWWLRSFYGCSPVADGVDGLEFWISGPAARAMESCSDAEVMAALHQLLARRLRREALPEPNGLVRSRWSNEPGIRGSYSFVPVGATGKDIDELAKPEGAEMSLAFAGEHTHRTFYSTVHGAWWSGVKLADMLVAKHKDST